MKHAKLKGWNRGTTPLRSRTTKQCDLVRQGKSFKCLDLSLPIAEYCSHCKALLVQ